MLNIVRHKVSLNKIRYIQDGFDLDLTYITPSIMAMGFPAVNIESCYRNPRGKVQKLLEKLHKDKYKVYNLCAEPKWSYSPAVFHGRVGKYPFHDHQAPPLELMGQFCKDVEEWLAKEGHIAAVHCKAGKGRAGMMICCWLIHSKTFPTADEAMKQYGARRTRDGKGVTIPSQRRYVRYYEDIVNFGLPVAPKIKVKSIFLQTSHYSKPESGEPWVEILVDGKEILYASKPVKVNKGEDVTVDVQGVEVQGDIKVNVYDATRASKGKPVCHFWFNTAFIENNKLSLDRIQIDKAWNDKKFKIFQKDFDITVEFEGAEVSTVSQMSQNLSKSSSTDKKAKKEKKHKKDKKDESITPKSDDEKSAPKGDEKKEESLPQTNHASNGADTIVFIGSDFLQSDAKDISSSNGKVATIVEETKPQVAVVAKPSDDSSSSTGTSDDSSGEEQQPVTAAVQPNAEETLVSQTPQKQESSSDSSSTNSSEESSEGEAKKAPVPQAEVSRVDPSSSDEERDNPAPNRNPKKTSSDSSGSSDSSSKEDKKKSSSESEDSDL